jgi:hypothetical protein
LTGPGISSDALHVVERYTPQCDTMYEATIEDPKVFAALKISSHLRQQGKTLSSWKLTVEFADEILYGHLRKQPSK